MSVIIGRALPDVRDGLKPAHRRVLYGMRNMGLASNRGYRKCAKIVGEVMGNFHPHGDASIYDTLVRLSQEFNMRYPLVDGQGNFGSVDGDMPAAMRYTEARLQGLADDLMADLEKETVDFVPNYDETTEEPTVLPAPIPNLLVNGSTGIAVGMATNVPPHNLTEVIDGVIYVIDEQQKSRRLAGLGEGLPAAASAEAGERATTREERLRQLFRIVTGPDFPTGGIIVGRSGIVQAYREGRGSITVRSRTEVETSKKGDRQSIVVTEIPYQVNKKRLIENIADLVRDKIIEGISDLRDESDRDGMRIVDRAQARRSARGDPQQPLQAHAAADDVWHHHAGHRARPAEGAEPSRVHRGVHRVPTRSRAAPHRVRAAEGRSARPHPRGAAHRPRSPRPGDCDHSSLQGDCRGARRADDEPQPVSTAGAGHPRDAAAAAHRSRTAEDRRRARGADEAHRAAPRDSRQRHPADAGRGRRTESGAREIRRRSGVRSSWTPKASSASRT